MKKYITTFKVDWQNQFVYRLNFILWRARNILRLSMTYFLWRGIFISNVSVFGYSQSQMLTYVFMVLIVNSIVLSAPSADNIGGEIGNGDLSNYLVKPISYLKFWFTRDLSSKLLNLIFAVVEVILLWLVFRPEIRFPASLETLITFAISCTFAVVIYFFVSTTTRFVAFWNPENTWTMAFLVLVLMEVLSGGIFPLDILPDTAYHLLQLTPFPYLVYFPIAIFVGKITGMQVWQILLQGFVYCFIMYFVTLFIWKKGLMQYSSVGK